MRTQKVLKEHPVRPTCWVCKDSLLLNSRSCASNFRITNLAFVSSVLLTDGEEINRAKASADPPQSTNVDSASSVRMQALGLLGRVMLKHLIANMY